jgi:predicted NUDIX family NTP pyrophosphohydrolase
MAAKSAGIVAYQIEEGIARYLLVHPGGPFYKNKDSHVWSIPKGEYADGEDGLMTAIREFQEEIGSPVSGEFVALTPVRQKSGKLVSAWAVKVNERISLTKSNNFSLEWPPRSGKMQEFPEVDKAEWFTLEEAADKIIPRQLPILEELHQMIRGKRNASL